MQQIKISGMKNHANNLPFFTARYYRQKQAALAVCS